MRDIIFRGKALIDNEFVYGYYSIVDGHHFIATSENGMSTAYIVDPETIGQDTGSKDKHGTKIFEGDICLSEYGVSYDTTRYPSFVNGTQKKNKVEIKFVQDEIHNFYGFNFKRINDEHFSIVYEVIGNVHEKE